MAESAKLQLIIDAQDRASAQLRKFDTSINKTRSTLSNFVKGAAGVLVATTSVAALVNGFKSAIKASNELDNALIGLNSVANAFNQNADAAKDAAVDLAKDGLLSVQSAAASLKNLLATGFSLPEAIELMKGFKDAAAFNRQGTLEFGQAIEGATQGIKNQNSILVDNAGITKNLSVILKEAGFSAQDLSNVTSDATIRQALYNGILKEASIFQGDAARMADTLAGKQAALRTQVFTLSAAFGTALKPIMEQIIERSSWMLSGLQGLADQMVKAGGIVEFLREKLVRMMEYIEEKTGLITIFKNSFEQVAKVYREKLEPELQKLWEQLRPLMPFIETLAQVFGVLLVAALIAVAKILEYTLIPLIEFLSKVMADVNKGVEAFTTLWEAGTDALSKVILKVDELIGKLKNLNAVSRAKDAISSFLGFGGARAAGGPVSAGSSYLVGERGPELFVPNTNGQIVPNSHMLSGGTTLNIIVNGDVSGQDLIDKVGESLIGKLKLSSATV